MRELDHNGFDFSDKALLNADIGYHYEVSHDGRNSRVSYVDGVFMVQGMDNGVMLLDLLARTGRDYEAVLFVDDKTRNIDNMARALKTADIDFYGFHYIKIDKTVSNEEVTQAQDAASDLTQLLKRHFVERATLMKDGVCAY
jgi:hypothetical protein